MRVVSGLWLVVQSFFRKKHQIERLPAPPMIPPHLFDDEIQLKEDGAGALMGRRYLLWMRTPQSPQQVIAFAARNLAHLTPEALSSFEKTSGSPWSLQLGDEFDITLTGPWDGRVRVIELTPAAFAFATLRGHPEAGKIRFEAVTGNNAIGFQITSWARSRDQLVDAAYHLGGKNAQTANWCGFLERLCAALGARALGEPLVFEGAIDAAS